MKKFTWLLAILLIADWVFHWQLAAWKIEKVKESTSQMKQEIEVMKDEVRVLETISKDLKQLIQDHMKEPKQWEEAVKNLNNALD